MLKVELINHRKSKNGFLNDGFDEYRKRLSRFCKLSSAKMKGVPDPEGGQMNIFFCIGSHPKGFPFISSEMLAETISKGMTMGASRMAVAIGREEDFASYGSMGFTKHALVSGVSDEDLSWVLVLEQIYRSFKILGNETYHK
jgi:23S rRNA (pseudouridine1915-N3)-methyltransferase